MERQRQRSPASARAAARDRAERRCLSCGRDVDHAEWCWRGVGPQWSDEQRVERERDELGKADAWEPEPVEPTDLAWLEKYRIAS
jgi:hypothetical protein